MLGHFSGYYIRIENPSWIIALIAHRHRLQWNIAPVHSFDMTKTRIQKWDHRNRNRKLHRAVCEIWHGMCAVIVINKHIACKHCNLLSNSNRVWYRATAVSNRWNTVQTIRLATDTGITSITGRSRQTNEIAVGGILHWSNVWRINGRCQWFWNYLFSIVLQFVTHALAFASNAHQR